MRRASPVRRRSRGRRVTARVDAPVLRLSASDLASLRLETAKAPMHIGALLSVEAAPLVDSEGALRLAEIRRRLGLRLDRAPELRRRVVSAGPLGGRPLWVDDAAFDIANHVREVRVHDLAPGEPQATAARLIGRLLDRNRPLWEFWFIMGFDRERCAVLVKIHHAMADGLAAVALMGALLDFDAEAPDPPASVWRPALAPDRRTVRADNRTDRVAAMRRAATSLRALPRTAATITGATRELATRLRTPAQHSSINRPVRPGRRVGYVPLDLGAVKRAGHAAGGTVNDVVLATIAGGLHDLMRARREHQSTLVTSVPVSLRAGGDRTAGNQVGLMIVPLPVADGDARRRLERVVGATRISKATQHPVLGQQFQRWMAATPFAQAFMARQRLVNTFATNVVGPPQALFLLGARVFDLVPFVIPTGNVTISFCACSYSGTLYLSVTADAASTPDIDVIVDGMARAWRELHDGSPGQDRPDEAGQVDRPSRVRTAR